MRVLLKGRWAKTGVEVLGINAVFDVVEKDDVADEEISVVSSPTATLVAEVAEELTPSLDVKASVLNALEAAVFSIVVATSVICTDAVRPGMLEPVRGELVGGGALDVGVVVATVVLNEVAVVLADPLVVFEFIALVTSTAVVCANFEVESGMDVNSEYDVVVCLKLLIVESLRVVPANDVEVVNFCGGK